MIMTGHDHQDHHPHYNPNHPDHDEYLHFLLLVELLVRHDGGGGVVGGLQQDLQSIYNQYIVNI